MKECPDCNGYGGDSRVYDMSEYVPCPTCEGSGEVPEGTKGWLENLLTTKL